MRKSSSDSIIIGECNLEFENIEKRIPIEADIIMITRPKPMRIYLFFLRNSEFIFFPQSTREMIF